MTREMVQLEPRFPEFCRRHVGWCWWGIVMDDNGRNDSDRPWRWTCEET